MCLNVLFRRRIGLSENVAVTFENLHLVLERTALTLPFENLRIISNRTRPITKENLVETLLVNREGGLCYELNTLLYHFLLDNGFEADLAQGVVFNKDKRRYNEHGRTHVVIVVKHEGQKYLADSGFGGSLPLMPVPLTGKTAASSNGSFRVKKEQTEHGDHVLEMKLRHKDADWRIGYAFDSKTPVTDADLNEVQRIIIEHEGSSFNKNRLISRLTGKGSVTLTDTSLTQWYEGVKTKQDIEREKFEHLLKEHFAPMLT